MKTIQVINYIASHPKFTKIFINGIERKTPLQAIALLSCEGVPDDWDLQAGHTSLEIQAGHTPIGIYKPGIPRLRFKTGIPRLRL